MKQLFFLIALFAGLISLQAQDNPFSEYGYQPKIATLSNGQFIESFDNDTIVQIGSVLFNTKSKQIIAFVEYDTLYSEATLEPDIVSRWMSPDPLASQFPSWSPYAAFNNNPMYFTDPDGRAVVPVNVDAKVLLNTALSSYGVSIEKFKAALQVTTENGVYRSNLKIPGSMMSMDPKGFKRHLKNEGIKLNKTQTQEAYNLYNALQTDDVYEVGVFIKPTANSTTNPGESGTETVEGVSPSTNENYTTFSRQFEDNPDKALDQNTNEEGYGAIEYKGPSNQVKATVIIDGTNEVPAQTLDKLNKVTSKIPKK